MSLSDMLSAIRLLSIKSRKTQHLHFHVYKTVRIPSSHSRSARPSLGFFASLLARTLCSLHSNTEIAFRRYSRVFIHVATAIFFAYKAAASGLSLGLSGHDLF